MSGLAPAAFLYTGLSVRWLTLGRAPHSRGLQEASDVSIFLMFAMLSYR